MKDSIEAGNHDSHVSKMHLNSNDLFRKRTSLAGGSGVVIVFTQHSVLFRFFVVFLLAV